jgi:hypothetical protein
LSKTDKNGLVVDTPAALVIQAIGAALTVAVVIMKARRVFAAARKAPAA